jgi:hypothetical protein
MTIDASIPLRAVAPQPIDLAGAYQKSYDLQNSAMVTQQNRLKLEDQQEAAADSDKLRSIYIETGGDPEETIKRAKTSGIGPNAILGLEDHFNTMRKGIIGKQKDEKDLELVQYDQILAMLSPIDDELDDAKAAQMFNQAYTIAKNRGLITDKTDEMLRQVMPNGFDRQAFKMIKASLTTYSKIAAQNEKGMRAQAAMIRAQSYATNLEAKIGQTDFRNKTDRMKAEAYIDKMESDIEHDANLDEISRLRLKDQTARWRAQLKQSQVEEDGRNARFDKGEKGKNDRLNTQEAGKTQRQADREASITARVKAKGGNTAPVQRNLVAAERLAKRLNPDWEDLDDETQDGIINDIFEGFQANEPIRVVGTQDKDAVFPDKATTVRPAAPAAKGKTDKPEPSKPKGNARRKGDGKKMPEWLAKQYAAQAGDINTAIQWATQDGWDIKK